MAYMGAALIPLGQGVNGFDVFPIKKGVEYFAMLD